MQQLQIEHSMRAAAEISDSQSLDSSAGMMFLQSLNMVGPIKAQV